MNLNEFFVEIREDEREKFLLSDFEIVPYQIDRAFVTGVLFKPDMRYPMFVNPVDTVAERELSKGKKGTYRVSKTGFRFNYLISTAGDLLYGNKHFIEQKKQFDPKFSKFCYPIARKIHFQIKTDFGLVIWSFIRRRKK